MKRWIAALGTMLLMPTLAMAQGEMVSISELRGQVEQMGRWKEKYDTPNGEVSVDVPIIVPDVERCPVVTVENRKPWDETMIREIQKKTGKRDGEIFCSYDIDGQTVEIQLLTNGNGSTTKYEAVKDVTMMAASDESDYFAHIGVNGVRTVEIDDIPLAPLEEILKRIEMEIEAGNIRAGYALRLGYLRYSNPEMTEYACAVPTWVLDCRYLTTENQRTADIFETENQENEERSIWKTYGFSQIPIDAQTGELKIITTGDEETFSVPKMMTWAELARKTGGAFKRR